MKIGIIGGTGPQGLGIAKRLAIAGEDVIVGSRKEEKALTVVGEANEEIKEHNPKELVGMANEDAAAAADVLILTVPLQAQSATLKTIKENAKGKVLLDATVPLETAIGGPVSNPLHINPGSAAERAAKILKDADVKAKAAACKKHLRDAYKERNIKYEFITENKLFKNTKEYTDFLNSIKGKDFSKKNAHSFSSETL